VIIVVPEHDVIPRLPLRLIAGRGLLGRRRGCDGDAFDWFGDGGAGGFGHGSVTVYSPLPPEDRPVLDRRFVADNVDLVTANCRNRGASADVARFAELDKLRRHLQADVDRLNHEAGQVSKSIAKAADAAEREARKSEGRRLREEVGAIEGRLGQIAAESDEILRQIPNLTHPAAPVGGEDAAVEIKRGKTPLPTFAFPARDHVALGEHLKLFDFEAGARVAGHGFYFLMNDTVMTTPDLARDTILEGTGFMPRGNETQIYSITGTDLSLVATAEITLGGAFHERIFEADELPLKICGISHCFRTEAGAHGKATRGLYRVHQFTKVEMFAFTKPEESEAMHGLLLDLECRLFDGLDIPYRVIDTASGDLGGPAYRKFDLEAWMPGRGAAGEWGEVTSTSNCTDFQARRLAVRYKKPGEKGTHFVHTLNGTAIAISRAIIAIIENHQQADGSVKVPQALVPWVGKPVLVPA
jgi:seryl-tRNA synthetase